MRTRPGQVKTKSGQDHVRTVPGPGQDKVRTRSGPGQNQAGPGQDRVRSGPGQVRSGQDWSWSGLLHRSSEK